MSYHNLSTHLLIGISFSSFATMDNTTLETSSFLFQNNLLHTNMPGTILKLGTLW